MNKNKTEKETKSPKPTLALIAHDAQKEDIVLLVKSHQQELEDINLIATRSTGQIIQSRTGLPVTLVESGPRGGDQQIGALVATGSVNAVIFMRDPLMAYPHEPDVSTLLRVCDVHNVPLTTNIASAEAVLHLLFDHFDVIEKYHMTAQLSNDNDIFYT